VGLTNMNLRCDGRFRGWWRAAAKAKSDRSRAKSPPISSIPIKFGRSVDAKPTARASTAALGKSDLGSILFDKQRCSDRYRGGSLPDSIPAMLKSVGCGWQDIRSEIARQHRQRCRPSPDPDKSIHRASFAGCRSRISREKVLAQWQAGGKLNDVVAGDFSAAWSALYHRSAARCVRKR